MIDYLSKSFSSKTAGVESEGGQPNTVGRPRGSTGSRAFVTSAG